MFKKNRAPQLAQQVEAFTANHDALRSVLVETENSYKLSFGLHVPTHVQVSKYNWNKSFTELWSIYINSPHACVHSETCMCRKQFWKWIDVVVDRQWDKGRKDWIYYFSFISFYMIWPLCHEQLLVLQTRKGKEYEPSVECLCSQSL